jgi:hypothetical protein
MKVHIFSLAPGKDFEGTSRRHDDSKDSTGELEIIASQITIISILQSIGSTQCKGGSKESGLVSDLKEKGKLPHLSKVIGSTQRKGESKESGFTSGRKETEKPTSSLKID